MLWRDKTAPGWGKDVNSSKKRIKKIYFSWSGSKRIPTTLNWTLASLGSSLNPLKIPQTFISFEYFWGVLIDFILELATFLRKWPASMFYNYPTLIILDGIKLFRIYFVSWTPHQGIIIVRAPLSSFSMSPCSKI